MKKTLLLVLQVIFLIFLFTATQQVIAADTVTVTDSVMSTPGSVKGLRVITWTYSSDDGTIGETSPIAKVTGTIVGAKHIPDGVNTPDAAADYTILDASSSGMDVLYGAGANIGASRTIVFPVESVNAGPVYLANETLYFAAGSLGAGTNAGVFKLYISLP
jgi:hypothetical protein